jgi:hypothetical protein
VYVSGLETACAIWRIEGGTKTESLSNSMRAKRLILTRKTVHDSEDEDADEIEVPCLETKLTLEQVFAGIEFEAREVESDS